MHPFKSGFRHVVIEAPRSLFEAQTNYAYCINIQTISIYVYMKPCIASCLY